MSLLEKASLIVTPNAYKESVLYSVVPNTTLGDMDVVRATTATRVNSAGLIESVGVNIPRIDYTNGSCPSLLVEPQRTNLLTYSEQFDNTSWLKYRLDLTTNTQISPSGVQNAETFTSSVGQSAVPAIANQSFVFVGNTRYSYSIFAKKIGTTDSFIIGYVDNSVGFTGGIVSYNLTTQSITITQSPNASVTATMQSVGNGWYRLVLNFLTIAVPTFNYVEMNIPSTSVTNTFAIWGSQLEAGSYATSYIPTVASTVTRNADVISKTGISSLIGQTEGTLFVDLKSVENGWVTLSDNSDANGVLLSFSKEYSTLNYYIYANSVDIIGTGFVAFPSEPMKLAFKYKSGEIKLFVNGILVYTNTATFTFSNNLSFFGNMIYWGGGLFEGKINSEQLYKTALTDTECINLTTL